MAGETILVTDDDDDIRAMVAAYLRDAGYRVIVAGDGAEALAAVAVERPDLVLADVDMPNLNGLELARRLRADPATAAIPILMLSALLQPREVLTGHLAGADDYLGKPVDLSMVLGRIEAMLERRAPAARPKGQVIVFLHAKGGVGTTTMAVSVATALVSGRGSPRVCLLDLNELRGHSATLLGLNPGATLAGAHHAWGERVDEGTIDGLLVTHPTGMCLLVAGRSHHETREVAASPVRAAVEHLRGRFDYTVVDTDTGLSPQTTALLQVADLACVVTLVARPALEATRDLLLRLTQAGVPVGRQRVVVARAPAGADVDRVATTLDREPMAIVARSDVLAAMADRGEPFVAARASEPAARELESLADSIRAALAAGSSPD